MIRHVGKHWIFAETLMVGIIDKLARNITFVYRRIILTTSSCRYRSFHLLQRANPRYFLKTFCRSLLSNTFGRLLSGKISRRLMLDKTSLRLCWLIVLRRFLIILIVVHICHENLIWAILVHKNISVYKFYAPVVN